MGVGRVQLGIDQVLKLTRIPFVRIAINFWVIVKQGGIKYSF